MEYRPEVDLPLGNDAQRREARIRKYYEDFKKNNPGVEVDPVKLYEAHKNFWKQV